MNTTCAICAMKPAVSLWDGANCCQQCWCAKSIESQRAAQQPAAATKDTNPKDALGSMRAPLHLNPVTAQIEQALAHAEGASKYGTANWTVAGARASVYAGAIERHFKKWLAGEDYDVIQTEAGEVKIHHLGKVMACCALVIDSRQRGVLVDDRPPALDPKQLYAMFTVAEDAMKKLVTLRKGEVKDWTIADTVPPK